MNQRTPVVYCPSELYQQNFVGEIYGFYHQQSNEYNIVSYEGKNEDIFYGRPLQKLGVIVSSLDDVENQSESPNLIGLRQENVIVFKVNNVTCKQESYNLLQNTFSRNTGILETDVMLDKYAIISGCGSVGSLVALELARSGVGNFILIDNDTIAYHNLCRHQCGVQDVGKFKVHAVKERILQINPSAKVATYPILIEEVPKEVFDNYCKPETIIIGCADNREGDIYASKISCIYNIPFVSIGFWTRAFAGEIFYSIPNKMPCYYCVFGQQQNNLSNRNSQNRRHYIGEENHNITTFEPGISVDINYVTIIAIKLIIDLFNLNTLNYIPKVINYLTQFTLVCNTCDTRIGGEEAEIFTHPLQVTHSIVIDYSNQCPPCQFI